MNILDRIKNHRDDATYIGHQTRPGWRGYLPFYRFFCVKHGTVENYPQGRAEILRCPKCDEEHLARQRSIREATKRTDPPKGADEPTRAKSVRPTQVKKSERESSESKEVR